MRWNFLFPPPPLSLSKNDERIERKERRKKERKRGKGKKKERNKKKRKKKERKKDERKKKERKRKLTDAYYFSGIRFHQ